MKLICRKFRKQSQILSRFRRNQNKSTLLQGLTYLFLQYQCMDKLKLFYIREQRSSNRVKCFILSKISRGQLAKGIFSFHSVWKLLSQSSKSCRILLTNNKTHASHFSTPTFHEFVINRQYSCVCVSCFLITKFQRFLCLQCSYWQIVWLLSLQVPLKCFCRSCTLQRPKSNSRSSRYYWEHRLNY